MTTINIDTDTLRRALAGEEDARKEVEALMPIPRPTTGLLGRWAKHPRFEDVLVTSETTVDGKIYVAHTDETRKDGANSVWVPLDELTFPEQTTRPGDVPPGEAWLIEVGGKRFHSIKDRDGAWIMPGASQYWCKSSAVTLISPLVPVHPTDDDEWVETQEEYEALPEGSIVAADGSVPMVCYEGIFRYGTTRSTAGEMAGVRSRALRKGWGK